MKKILLAAMLFSCIKFFGQQKIHFDYDTAGNQITREFCLTCLAKSNSKEISELKDSDLLKFLPEDNFSYYPNPVKEELFLKWDNSNIIKISSIKLFSLNGALLKSFENQENLLSQNILFRDYPNGLYIVILSYSNGEEKSIKIIKQ
jgi:hypothetical protein